MTAPSNIYHAKALRFTKGASVFQHSMVIRDYFSLTDAQLKEKFKLDYKVSLTSSQGNCFIGCVIAGSVNSQFHNSAWFGARFENLILLTDAGLNFKPPVPAFQTQSGQSTLIDILENSIFLRAYAGSSEFEETDITLKAADSDNLTIFEEVLFDTIAEAQNETYTAIEILFDSLYFRVGKTYILTLKATNAEGDTYSSTLSLSPAAAAVNFKYGATLDAAINASAGSTVYVNRKISNAVVSDSLVFYSNSSGSTYAATGYYLSTNADDNGRYKFYRVTGSSGQVTEINQIVARSQDIYYYYSAISIANAISQNALERILYYEVMITPPDSDFENRRYFVGPFIDSSYAAQGYYVKADRATAIYVGTNGVTQVLLG